MMNDPITTATGNSDELSNGLDDDEGCGYTEPVSQLLTLGDLRDRREPHEYVALGLTEEHIPDLIRMLGDAELMWADAESSEVWAHIHAWRALGQLRAADAVQPLLDLIDPLLEADDDWVLDEMPGIFGQIGPSAIPALAAYVEAKHKNEYSLCCASEGLQLIGSEFPDERQNCIAPLIARLERFRKNTAWQNASLIHDLTKLRSIEALPLIERVFAEERADEFLMGDWEEVQIEFGLKTTRDKPARPFGLSYGPQRALLEDLNTIESLRSLKDEEFPPDGTTESPEPTDLIGPVTPISARTAAKKAAKRKQASKSRKVNRKHK